MKRRLLIAALGLVALLAAAMLALPLIIDVDAHRPEIEKAIAGATGRDASLGALKLSLFPSPSLRAAGVTIGEDPRFGTEPFLEAGGLSVSVRVLPLLAGRLEIGSIVIDRPSVRVTRAAGGWSLASLLSASRGAPGAAASGSGGAGGASGIPPEGEADRGGGDDAGALVIRSVRLDGGTLAFRDEVVRPGAPLELKASDIELTLTDPGGTGPMAVDLSMTPGPSGRLTIRGDFGPLGSGGGGEAAWPVDARVRAEGLRAEEAAPWLAAFTGLRLRGGTLDMDLTARGTPPRALEAQGELRLSGLVIDPLIGSGAPVGLDASLGTELSLDGGLLEIARGDLAAGGTRISVTGSIGGEAGAAIARLRIRSEKTSVEGLVPVISILGPFVPAGLGRTGTVAIDATLAGSLDRPESLSFTGKAVIEGLELSDGSLTQPLRGISGTVELGVDSATIEGFEASLGASRLAGSCRITKFEEPAIDIDLKAPMLDVDELLTLLAPAGSAAVEARGGPPSGARLLVADAAAGAGPSSAPAAAPARAPGALERITVRGVLGAERVKFMNLALSGLTARLGVTEGIARVEEARMSLYGGTFEGAITAELARAGPPFTLSASLRGVDFNALASDFSPDLAGLLHGTLEAGLSLAGTGITKKALRSALAGDATFSLVDGKLATVGMLGRIASALESAGGRGIGAEETPFTFLGGTFRIRGGKVRTDDFRLDSADISMKGQGRLTMDLGLDLDLQALISPEVTADMVAVKENLRFLKDKKDRIRLDLKVGGTLPEPAVGVDAETIRRIIRNATRERLGGDILKDLRKKKEE